MNPIDFDQLMRQLEDFAIRHEALLYIGGVVVLAVCTSIIASQRGYAAWAPLLVLIIPLGALIAMALPPRRRCPDCAGWNDVEARICRWCRRELPAPISRRRPPLIPML